MIAVTINGKPVQLEGSVSLKQFLDERDVDPKFVAVAYNGNVLQKEDYSGTILNEGDVVEIVQPVGGG